MFLPFSLVSTRNLTSISLIKYVDRLIHYTKSYIVTFLELKVNPTLVSRGVAQKDESSNIRESLLNIFKNVSSSISY